MSKDYQGQVIDFYARRHDYDDDFTQARALKLVNYLYLQKSQSVLDVATGTGFIAVAIAPKVKSVIGIDFTPEMIARAEKKLEALNIENISLINADIAAIDFAESSFDLITCSMAIALFADIPQVLGKWYQWLKKGGSIAFSCNNVESHFMPLIGRVCQETYGFELPNLHTPVATPEKCRQLLENAGFTNISVNVEQLGQYLPLETAKNFWYGQYFHPRNNPLDRLSAAEIATLVANYRREIEKNATDRGVWQDATTFFVTATKS
jgi:protein-L-isoaspartate(D-aspartate) O-methyltransferase